MKLRNDSEPTSAAGVSRLDLQALLSVIQVAADRAGRMYRLRATGREVVRGKLLDWLLRRGPDAIRRREDPEVVSAYIWRVASRAARAQAETLEERRREAGRELAAFADGVPHSPGPAPPKTSVRPSRFVEVCLSDLTPLQREVVRVHLLQGRTLEETAFCLDTTRNAARHAYRRAIARLERHADELCSAAGLDPPPEASG